jgi:3-hydroxyacyl-CoA dehydrogenase
MWSRNMGAGIAQVIAQCGHEVFLRDIDEKYVTRGIEGIKMYPIE